MTKNERNRRISPQSGTHAGVTVPVFSLYGEAEPAAQAELVHIEDIRLRSAPGDWHIKPHMHRGLFQVLFLIDGSVEIDVDGRMQHVDAPAAVTVPPAIIHSFRFDPDTEGFVLTVSEAALSAQTRHREMVDSLLVAPQVIGFDLMPANAQRIAALMEQLTLETADQASGRALMLEWLVNAIMLLIGRQQAASAQWGTTGHQLREFNRFRTLVEAHFLEHWTVAQYAETLDTTEGKLNRLCQAIAGQSAFEVAQARLLLEAQRRLIYVAAPIAELSFELGFEDPAYFSRYFKNRVGMTPSMFRRKEKVA